MDDHQTEDRGTLARTLDCLEEEISLFDLAGEVLHENRALACRLARPGAEPLRLKIRELACSVAAHIWRETESGSGKIRPAVRHIRIADGRFRLQASYLGAVPPDPDSAILITLQRRLPTLSPAKQLEERYRLTRQEVRVALLLADRKSNEEIAHALGISCHTARHHTEHVLAKLGLHSRSEVAALLTQ